MTAPFPNLLRRSAFVTHDPTITRVYTSNPSSTSRYGDWGFKSPISTPRGPRYIKISSLDGGPGIGSDWRSAEREARFMEMWGDGRVPWTTDREVERAGREYRSLRNRGSNEFTNKSMSGLASGSSGAVDTMGYVEPVGQSLRTPGDQDFEGREGNVKNGRTSKDWLPNIEAMTKKEFDRYLEEIRSNRPRYLSSRVVEGMKTMEEGSDDHPSDPKSTTSATIVSHTLSPHSHLADTALFQAEMTRSKLTSPTSSDLHSTPHELNGLSYSRQPPSSIPLSVSSIHKGRALNQQTRAESRQRQSRSAGNYSSSGTNDTWVIGIGGLTAERNMDGNRTIDSPILTAFDYSVDSDRNQHQNQSGGNKEKEQSAKGVNNFRITKAILHSPPKVIDVANSNLRNRWGTDILGRRFRGSPQSSAVQPNPLDTFKFNINVSEVGTNGQNDNDASLAEELDLGSRSWVARDRNRKSFFLGMGDRLGQSNSNSRFSLGSAGLGSSLGGPKNQRTKSGWLIDENVKAVEEKKTVASQNQRVADLLAKVRMGGRS